jgi:hypothetical protein
MRRPLINLSLFMARGGLALGLDEGDMSSGAFAFFAITLGTISVALAALLMCMVIQGQSSAASASPLLTHAADRPFCLSYFSSWGA